MEALNESINRLKAFAHQIIWLVCLSWGISNKRVKIRCFKNHSHNNWGNWSYTSEYYRHPSLESIWGTDDQWVISSFLPHFIPAIPFLWVCSPCSLSGMFFLPVFTSLAHSRSIRSLLWPPHSTQTPPKLLSFIKSQTFLS